MARHSLCVRLSFIASIIGFGVAFAQDAAPIVAPTASLPPEWVWLLQTLGLPGAFVIVAWQIGSWLTKAGALRPTIRIVLEDDRKHIPPKDGEGE